MEKEKTPRELQSSYRSELTLLNRRKDQHRQLEADKRKIQSVSEVTSYLKRLEDWQRPKLPAPIGQPPVTYYEPTPPSPDSAVGKGLREIEVLGKKKRKKSALIAQSIEKMAQMEVEAISRGVELPPRETPGDKAGDRKVGGSGKASQSPPEQAFLSDFQRTLTESQKALNRWHRVRSRRVLGELPATTESETKIEPPLTDVKSKVPEQTPQEPEKKRELPTNIFVQNGDVREITFQSKKFPHLKDCVGYRYIRELFQGETFDKPTDLYYAVNGRPDQEINKHAEARRQEDPADPLNIVSDYEPLQKYDKVPLLESERHLQKKLLELITERSAAKEDGDEAQVFLIDNDKEQIEQQLKNLTVGRKRTKWGSNNLKAQKSISGAIHRAIKTIKGVGSEGKSLAKHLIESLTPVKFPYKYKPNSPRSWES